MLRNPAFCPQIAFTCLNGCQKKTAIISLHSLNITLITVCRIIKIDGLTVCSGETNTDPSLIPFCEANGCLSDQ
jgi:hypothetical protein